MRFIPTRRSTFLFLLLAELTVFPITPLAQQNLPYDTHVAFKAQAPHINSLRTANTSGNSGSVQATNLANFEGAPYTVGASVAPTTTFPEAEEYVALSLSDPTILVAVISDFALRGGYDVTKYAFSMDNGSTWSENYVPMNGNLYPITGDGQAWESNSDPVVAIDRLGNVYSSNLYLNVSNHANGVYVSAGKISGGVSFAAAATYPVVTNLDPNTIFEEDKPWITVDNSNSAYSGSVYETWTHFVANATNMILFSRSRDQAKTWSAPLQISLTAQNGAVQGAQAAISPKGEVYVVYEVFYVGNRRQQFLTVSTDGGVSFSAPVAISPVFNELNFNSTYRKFSFASLAVSPTNGKVYVVYADYPSPATGAEIEFIQTSGGNTHFTSPVVINDSSAGEQFFPSIAADSSGTIHACWFDTRNSPGNTSFYDIYATFSSNNASTFRPNARVTSSSVNAGAATFIGDYGGIAAGGGFAHPVWTSGGFNNGQLQTTTLH